MSRGTRECERADRLKELQAGGHVPSAADRAFLERHLAACPACAADRRIEDLLGYRGPETSPLAPLDDVSRRRLVQQLVASASVREPRPRRKVILASGLAAAAAIVALLVGALLLLRHPGERAGLEKMAPPQILLVSGEVSLPDRIAEGAVLRTGAGQLAVELGNGVRFLLAEGSILELRRSGVRGTELSLSRGRVLVSVPHRTPRLRVAVRTPFDTVRVRGTVFAVTVGAATTRVWVLRGQVAVQARSGAEHVLSAGQGYETGLGRRVFPEADSKAWIAAWRTLRETARGDATLVLESEPSGASVTVDGWQAGRTPLRLKVAAGRHEVLLAAPGRRASRMAVELATGAGVRRKIVLPAVPPAPAARPGPGQAPSARTARRARPSRRPRAEKRPAGPESLLAEARRLRSEGRDREAAAVYRRLLAKWPGSRAAATARVLLGWLLLRRLGAPARALAEFDTYLRQGGPLSQEALYGSILAVRRLGRRREEARRIQRFLERYPSALQARGLRQRLEELDRP